MKKDIPEDEIPSASRLILDPSNCTSVPLTGRLHSDNKLDGDNAGSFTAL